MPGSWQGLRVRFDLPYGPEEDEERAKRKRPPTPRPKDKPSDGRDGPGGHDGDEGTNFKLLVDATARAPWHLFVPHVTVVRVLTTIQSDPEPNMTFRLQPSGPCFTTAATVTPASVPLCVLMVVCRG